jgi:DNA-binding LacI/PurR family transcriptional regulator
MKANESLYLYSEIKERIQNDTKDLPPHTRIMTRAEMIKAFKVTRTTVEKAISQLIGEGYLYSRDGSGTYIAEKENNQQNSTEKLSGSWGVILPNIASDTYPETLRGIEDIAHQNNYNVIICNTDNDKEKQDQYINKLIKSGVNGIIVVPVITYIPSVDIYNTLLKNNIPFVFCNRGVDGIIAPRILSNNFAGSYTATKHLIHLGYKYIAFLSPPMYSNVEQRYMGYLAAMNELELSIDPDNILIEDTPNSSEPGYESGKVLLQKKIPPDAVVCFNDTTAKGFYKAAQEFGFIIGKDIGVVGYDDSKICEMLDVKLTSIQYPKYETGVKAAETLMKFINKESIKQDCTIILQPKLIIRQSCPERI